MIVIDETLLNFITKDADQLELNVTIEDDEIKEREKKLKNKNISALISMSQGIFKKSGSGNHFDYSDKNRLLIIFENNNLKNSEGLPTCFGLCLDVRPSVSMIEKEGDTIKRVKIIFDTAIGSCLEGIFTN